jgi:hypothetical protein
MHYLKVVSHAYGVAETVAKMASQKENAFYVLRFEVARSVITVQPEFRARFKKEAPHKDIVSSKPCTKLTLHSNHRSGHFKTEHTEAPTVATPSWIMVLRPRSKHGKQTAGSA